MELNWQVRDGVASLIKKRIHNTTHGIFKLQKRWAKLLYQILSISQDKGKKRAPGVVLHSALPKDKKKYILLNKSSLEQQKETRFQDRGTNLSGGEGSIGNRVFPLRPPQTRQFGKGLNCAETGLHALSSRLLAGSRAGVPGVKTVFSEETKRSQSTKVQPVCLSEKRPLFPGLAVGKASDNGHEKASQRPWE